MTERTPDDFVDAVRAAEDHIAQAHPPDPDHQRALLGAVLAREAARPARRLRAWMFGGAGALAAAAAALTLAWPHLSAPLRDAAPPDAPVATAPSDTPSEPPGDAPTTTSPLDALGLASECDARDDNLGAVSIPTGCDIDWPALASSLTTAAPTTLAAAPDGLAVRAGEVTFDVNPDRPNRRLTRVLVSGGVIEVIGTRFTVIELGERGEVTLHRGSIRFVPTSGEPRTLSPGDSHAWGEETARLAPPVDPTPEPPRDLARKKPRVIAKKHEGTIEASELTTLRELRRLERYDEASRMLMEMSRRDLDRPTLEILNYERGELLGLQGKTRAACAHWKKHQRRFARGAYTREVRGHIARLECRK